jgi:hypothetical protein
VGLFDDQHHGLFPFQCHGQHFTVPQFAHLRDLQLFLRCQTPLSDRSKAR